MTITLRYFIILNFLFLVQHSFAQPLNQKKGFTRQDTLRGSVTPERAWWNVIRYTILVEPDYNSKTIKGWNEIEFEPIQAGKNKIMQLDLQQPMQIDSIKLGQGQLVSKYTRDGNIYLVDFGNKEFFGNLKEPMRSSYSIRIYFSGKPREAVNPPWDGGWIWSKDAKGRPWMTVACQGLGASVWYPCKDYQGDEPDNGASLTITVPDTLVAVGNGKLTNKKNNNNGTTSWAWTVKSPINNYNIVPYIGKYVNFTDTLNGEKGKLDLSYWVMDYNLDKAKKQFDRDVKPMLRCFEYWFGPYPFYEDSYKLVESSHLGMEHQSATAYGNKYMDGYLGRDLSGSGWGKKWDYIIIHESGHEWFANNITTNDIADMWVHEGITDYSETLFVEYYYGKAAGDEYTQGLRRNIRNDKPVIGPYGVNQEGSGDMYNKGNNMMHTIRQVINNDSLFRKILRGLTKEFYHKTVDTKDVETYITKQSGKDLSKIFDQYLRTTKIPVLEYEVVDKEYEQSDYLVFRWKNCISGFNMPVKVYIDKKEVWLNPKEESTCISVKRENGSPFVSIDKNFYITAEKEKLFK